MRGDETVKTTGVDHISCGGFCFKCIGKAWKALKQGMIYPDLSTKKITVAAV